jgi:hypothetical protein
MELKRYRMYGCACKRQGISWAAERLPACKQNGILCSIELSVLFFGVVNQPPCSVAFSYLGFRQVSEGTQGFKDNTFAKQCLVFGMSCYTCSSCYRKQNSYITL